MIEHAVIFPGTLIERRDVFLYAIPTVDAAYGGEYQEGHPIDAFGQTWHVLEWNFEHNCFIVTDHDPEIIDATQGDAGKLALFDFFQKVWGDVPETQMPLAISQCYQPRLL